MNTTNELTMAINSSICIKANGMGECVYLYEMYSIHLIWYIDRPYTGTHNNETRKVHNTYL